ncbi:MAG: YcxB family protein [Ruminococcus sp.]|nr:YcxB family protein [Ruminococcus sp.]
MDSTAQQTQAPLASFVTDVDEESLKKIYPKLEKKSGRLIGLLLVISALGLTVWDVKKDPSAGDILWLVIIIVIVTVGELSRRRLPDERIAQRRSMTGYGGIRAELSLYEYGFIYRNVFSPGQVTVPYESVKRVIMNPDTLALVTNGAGVVLIMRRDIPQGYEEFLLGRCRSK